MFKDIGNTYNSISYYLEQDMPWREKSLMSLRKDFVFLSLQEGSNITELCKRFNISRKTGYKWMNRYKRFGDVGLQDQSKKPKLSPKKTPYETEEVILQLRDKHPVWGGRKLYKRLTKLGHVSIPSSSAISNILKRNGRINPNELTKHKEWNRFEAEKANDLWQMDFKGYFNIKNGQCHPLTVLDDHSRYSIGIEACKNETYFTVKERLIAIFSKYGLPQAILSDNGAPFGGTSYSRYSKLGVWLIRLGIKVLHGRPYHPQTQGKEERFHRTLKAEVLNYLNLHEIDILGCQTSFNRWRSIYNHERPHEALDMKVPGEVYTESKITFHNQLIPIEYGPDDIVRKVDIEGLVSYKDKKYRVGKGFYKEQVALRYTRIDGILDVYFCNQRIKKIDLRKYKGA